MGKLLVSAQVCVSALVFCFTSHTSAQTSLQVYSDIIVNGFDDWSWASHNVANTTPVHSGSKSISVSGNAANWEGISFHHSAFSVAPYASFSFWANGGTSGGQRLQVYAEYATNTAPGYVISGSLAANTWQQFTIPLSSLGIADRPDFVRITIQMRADGTSTTFYLDDVQFDAKALPGQVNVSVSSTQYLRTVDARHFGVNLAIWDGFYDSPQYTNSVAVLQEMGTTIARMPGGSLSDEYHWATGTSLNNTWQWAASFDEFVRVLTNASIAQAFVTVNYGTGTPQEAANWVRYANLTNHLGYKYWEIGNECYGTWETDSNTFPHDPYTYAVRASNYIAQMKAADPTIKVGVVGVPGETSNDNGYRSQPAYNSRTGQTNFGWTAVMLTTLKGMNVTPDFLVHHHYPEWTDPNNPLASNDNDSTLLQSTGNWAQQSADLRQQIQDYFGAAGTNIELVVTENNSDAGAQGRQSTSVINGLYYADSLAQLLKTEFNSFVWWDLRNGTDTGGYFGSGIYGWRTFGDLGMVNGASTRLPAFYAAKLMRRYASPGDRILSASSDYGSLTAYGCRHNNGSLAILLLNKLGTTNLTASLSTPGFTPNATYRVDSWGIRNDEATRTNSPGGQDITVASVTGAINFGVTVPPYTMSVVSLYPAAPQLALLPSANGTIAFELQGQRDVPYQLQTSTNATNWVSVSTNVLTTGTMRFTNNITGGNYLFWRARWQP